MKGCLLILILPNFIIANINIGIETCRKTDKPVTFHGNDVRVINDSEEALFQLTDANVKRGAKGRIGKSPDYMSLKSSSIGYDLYKMYNWIEVKRFIGVDRVTVLDHKTKLVTVLTHEFVNNSTENVALDTGITQTVLNEAKSLWVEGNHKEFHNVPIDFAVKYDDNDGIVFESYWGEDFHKENIATLGAEDGISVNLKPNASIVAKILARKGSMRVAIDYIATVKGVAALNYINKYGSHHFWGLGLDEVLKGAGLNGTVTGRQVVEMSFYCNASLVLFDPKIGKLVI